VARAKTRTKPNARTEAKASRWRLHYVTDADEFECDFVIAKSALGDRFAARRTTGTSGSA
jgi:hypothetical protein